MPPSRRVKSDAMKPSRVIILFLFAGVALFASVHAWGIATLLLLFLVMAALLVFVKSFFPRPGERTSPEKIVPARRDRAHGFPVIPVKPVDEPPEKP